MKKSTLITTIAMIVVVVVALSTATYAWFTSSRQAIATTTITVQSSSEWTIQNGVVAEDTGNVTFQPAGDTITFDATLAGDVWAPKATTAIAAKTTNNNPLSQSVSKVDWITAKQSNTAVSGQTIWATGTASAYPNVIRVLNTKQDSASQTEKNLQLKVYVILGSDPTEATKYAATCLTYYVSDGIGGEGHVHTNGYKMPTTAISSTAEAGDVGVAVNSDANPGAGVTVAATDSQNKPTYAGTGAVGAKINDEQVLTTLGITNQDYVLTYTVPLGSVDYQSGINLAIFTWIDGYDITDTSLGSTLTIVYAFSTGA